MKIRFYTGRRCNLDCIHCFDTEKPKMKFPAFEFDLKKHTEFIKSFNEPCIVGFCGGEPMLSKNILPFIEWLTHNGHHVLLNTNMLVHIEELVSIADMSKVAIFGSFHIRQIESKNLQNVFIKNYHIINQYIDVMPCFDVAEIAEPTYTEEEVKHYFELYKDTHGIDFHFVTYLDVYDNNKPYNYSEHQLDYFGIRENRDKIQLQSVYPKCNAGVDYIIVEPSGDIYQCEFTAWHDPKGSKQFKLGNTNTGFKRLEKTIQCSNGCCTCPTEQLDYIN